MRDRGWKYYPALKLAIPLASGIAVAHAVAPPLSFVFSLLASVAFLLALLLRRGAPAAGIAALGVVFLSGMLLMALNRDQQTEFPEGMKITKAELIGRVVQEPIIRQNRVEMVVACDSLLFHNASVSPDCHVLVRLYDTTIAGLAHLPTLGDHISVTGTAAAPSGPTTPGGFDYASYLRSRGIGLTFTPANAASLWVFREGDIGWIERNAVAPVQRAAREFSELHVGGEEGGIIRALLIGEREFIDAPTRQAFMRTGTTHVLAVSGLHVAVVALGLFVLVSWIPHRGWQVAAYAVAIGYYTLLTGGTPSILRAALMAVAFMAARSLGRVSRPLNTLGLAILIILLLSPSYLFDIGFQLSVASVAGILMLYGPLRQWLVAGRGWIENNRLFRGIAAMMIVSFAAQAFTLPIVLHHFGYVSLVGLLANLVVVPLTSIGMAVGLVGTVFQLVGMDAVANWYGAAAFLTTAAAEWVVRWFASPSFAGIEFPPIGVVSMFVLAALVLFLAFGQTARQYLLRTGVLLAGVWCVVLAERLLDPLQADRLAFLLPSREGIAVATAADDTVRVYGFGRDAADSSLFRFAGEGLRRRIGATTLIGVVLDSALADTRRAALCINERGPEFAVAELPIIISRTARRAPGIIHAFNSNFLQVPSGLMLDSAIVMEYDGNGWKIGGE
ncbi:MAG: ComEC family competence protein [Chlorobi bacterium]|nr:ComEC family competence protein [Chlorobiota bacterium]MBX7217424.1 ComEC family competence protein [Candidatus Kapabacteria bacterium]